VPPALWTLLTAAALAQEAPATLTLALVTPREGLSVEARGVVLGEARIVALGSSSTAGAGSSRPWRAYPARLESLLRAALQDAALEPASLGYIEAHGTGTPLGDPIEVEALAAVCHEQTDHRDQRRGKSQAHKQLS
jgi:3-oxoacyl-(acyl-carrier-protein) synthase